MKIYYIEYKTSVKFFNDDKTLEIERGNGDKTIEKFLKAVYLKYGKTIKFISLI